MRQVWITKAGPPEVLQVREAPDPTPQAGEVRIRVEASGINFADLMARMGIYPDAPKIPCVVGYEVAGTIDALGEGVTEFQIGQHVLALTRFGGYADMVCVPALTAFARPPQMSAQVGAGILVNYVTAYQLLVVMGSLRQGDRVVIQRVLSELRQHLGTELDICYPLRKKKVKETSTSMNCPYCAASTMRKRTKKTELGYATFYCSACRRTFNERTGTPFNYLEVPTDVVFLVVLWRLRYKLSLRDVAEMFLERGFMFTHETVRDWEARFAPLLADQLRTKRRGQAGRSWYVDETYIKVHGKWCYLYRAIDHDGNLVDSMVSEKRNMEAAQTFFKQAVTVVGHVPEQVTTDGHTSYPRAIRETIGDNVQHRTSKYLNNLLEQDHRGIKQRYYPMHGFGTVASAARFCCAFDELRNYLRPRCRTGDSISLSEQRLAFLDRLVALQTLLEATF